MKLIVGLGNPGNKYVGTRHNVGYEILGFLGRRYGTDRPKSKFQGELMEACIGTQRVILLSPVTYMNLSGHSVRACVDFYKIEAEDILILCDDVHLPLGRLRIRFKGSAGGQKGLAHILQMMGTDQITRLRVGVGQPPDGWNMADFVLARFSSEERAEMDRAVAVAAEAASVWAIHDVQTAMNQFNIS